MNLFDTHTHLDDEQFDAIRDDVVARAENAGVSEMIAVGTTALASERCCDLAACYPSVWASVGIQPNYCHQATVGDWDRIVELSHRERVVAIGETGLDRYWDYTPFAVQQDFFDRHMQLARKRKCPFVVHMRDCGPDILVMLREAARQGPLCGIMHSYTGDAAMAAECIDLGMHISFAGMITFKKADDLRNIARDVPAERILIETDCPYLSPHPKRGQRPNEPALLIHTATCLAEVRGESLTSFAQQTTTNARRLFELDR